MAEDGSEELAVLAFLQRLMEIDIVEVGEEGAVVARNSSCWRTHDIR